MSEPSVISPADLDRQRPLLEQLLEALDQGALELPPLPAVAAEISSLLSEPDVSAAAIAQLIQRDPVLAGEIMRVSNSAAYSPRTPIVSLQQAIAWLGMAEIQQVAFTICVHGEVFAAPGHDDEIEALWQQSLAAGLWAKELARLKRRNVETAYLGGLLHRVGRAAAIRALSRIEHSREEPIEPLTFAEIVDACEGPFGTALADRWQLPELVTAAVASWSTPSPEASIEALQTYLAHLLAVETFRPDGGDAELEVPGETLEALNIYTDELADLRTRADSIRTTVACL